MFVVTGIPTIQNTQCTPKSGKIAISTTAAQFEQIRNYEQIALHNLGAHLEGL
jgi:hypothetical protein